MKIILPLLLFTSLLSACASIKVPHQSYEGSPRPQTEIATIYIDVIGGLKAGYFLSIETLNGKSFGLSLSPTDPRNTLIAVLPGEHVLGVSVKRYKAEAVFLRVNEWKFTIPFDASAGRLYSVCLSAPSFPEMLLRDVGPINPRISSVEEWQKYILQPCIYPEF
jgi:hypothetical protein